MNHVVQCHHLETGEQRSLSYDKLVIATGATPILPPVPGTDRAGVTTLQSMADADYLRKVRDEGRIRNAVVVGLRAATMGCRTREVNVTRACKIADPPETARVRDLRRRVREAMDEPPARGDCPPRIEDAFLSEPLPVRKARAIALKLAHMPVELWTEQLYAGSMTLEDPRVHAERGFPTYTTEAEREAAAERGVTPQSVFGHIVPDYPTLLRVGLNGIRAEAQAERARAQSAEELAFLDSAIVAIDGVVAFAGRLADH